MAPHSSTLAWKIPWMEEPGGLQSMGSLGIRHDWATSLSLFTFKHWKRKWQPTPVFLPGESQGRGSLLGCRLWGRTEWDTIGSDLAAAAAYWIQRRRQWQPTPVLLPGKSHGRRSLVGYSPWGRQESDTTERLHFHFSLSSIGKGNGNPLQSSCLENPRDGGAWWAAVYGVAQSRTLLKRLSSSSSSLPIELVIGLSILSCVYLQGLFNLKKLWRRNGLSPLAGQGEQLCSVVRESVS